MYSKRVEKFFKLFEIDAIPLVILARTKWFSLQFDFKIFSTTEYFMSMNENWCQELAVVCRVAVYPVPHNCANAWLVCFCDQLIILLFDRFTGTTSMNLSKLKLSSALHSTAYTFRVYLCDPVAFHVNQFLSSLSLHVFLHKIPNWRLPFIVDAENLDNFSVCRFGSVRFAHSAAHSWSVLLELFLSYVYRDVLPTIPILCLCMCVCVCNVHTLYGTRQSHGVGARACMWLICIFECRFSNIGLYLWVLTLD